MKIKRQFQPGQRSVEDDDGGWEGERGGGEGVKISRKEDGCERSRGQKAVGWAPARTITHRELIASGSKRRVIILGYPLIQRLPAYRCSVGWLIRTKRPLLRFGEQREAIASRCSAIRLEETLGWWIFFPLLARYRSGMWTREIDAA